MRPLVLTQVSAGSNVAVNAVPPGVCDAQAARARHPLAQPLAERVDQPVVGAHALLHDLRRHADHVRVADRAALDDRDDRHAGAELALLRLHAEDAGVGALERVEHRRRRGGQRPRGDLLDQHAVARRADVVERRGDARGDLAARLVGDQRDALAGLDAEADFDGVARAGRELGGRRTEHRSRIQVRAWG